MNATRQTVNLNVDRDKEYTPYTACKVVNEALKKMGVDKVLPPQMFYTYADKGMLNNEAGTRRVTGKQLQDWFDKYASKF